MSGESGRLRRAVDRLMDAQREALDATDRALDGEAEGLDEDERPGTNELLEATLVDVRDILGGGA